jgi:membrane protein DedA with SNARE-associated domain
MLAPALASLTSNVGYPALILLVAVESSGVPVPGETALITAGVLASRGDLAIVPVIVLAAAGAIVGDNLGYLLGRRVGRRIMLRGGRFEAALERAERFFARHGAKAVFLGRWVTGLRIWAAWVAGATHMRWRTFLLWNALGGIVWAASVGLAAYLIGAATEKIATRVGEGAAAVVILALVAGPLVIA